jgi:drug/metabolite transporter (DMT)-like permease
MMLSWAELTLPSSAAALIVSIEPAWFVILDWLFFSGQRPTPKTLIAQLIGFAGCAVLVFADPDASIDSGVSRSVYLLSFGAVLLSGIAWVLGSLLARSPDTHPDSGMASGMQMISGGVVLLAASLLNRDYARLGGASLSSAAALAYLITFGSIFAYSAFMFLLKNQPTARVVSHTFVNPIVAVILGWMFAGESLTPEVALSAAMIVASVILTIYPGRVAVKAANTNPRSNAS